MSFENDTALDQKALLDLNDATILRVFGPWMVFFEIVALVFFVLFSGTDDNYFYLMLGFILFIPILTGLAYYTSRAKITKEAPGTLDRTVIHYVFGEDFIRIEERSTDRTFRDEADYRNLWKIVESPDHWFLYFQKRAALIVAKSGFSGFPPADFPDFLRERRKARKKALPKAQ